MSKIVNDWIPETQSLLQTLEMNGCKIIGGNNGEETFAYGKQDEFLKDLTACDEVWLYVEIDGQRRTLFLVYGNCPGELICDYGIHPVLDEVADIHYDEWSVKEQPQKEID